MGAHDEGGRACQTENTERPALAGLRILRLPAVQELTGLKRSAIYAHTRCGFPKPIKLGPRACGWIEGEVTAWIAARIHQSRIETE